MNLHAYVSFIYTFFKLMFSSYFNAFNILQHLRNIKMKVIIGSKGVFNELSASVAII